MTAIDLEQLAQQGVSARKPRSLWADAWRRLRYSITARIGGVVAVIIVLAAIITPIVDPYNPKLDSNLENCPPGALGPNTCLAPTAWGGISSGASCTGRASR